MIKPTDVGKRISLQYFDEDGGRREAVGVLERAEMDGGSVVLCVRKRDDTLVRIPLSRVRFGKVVDRLRGR
jgi:hypothetical protein